MKLKKSTVSAIILLIGLATVIGLSGLNFLLPQTSRVADESNDEARYKTMNKISLSTKDNVKIAADLYEKDGALGWLILVHMMPAVKESWQDFAVKAQDSGYESIAIDLRGHGESDGGPSGYTEGNFPHQKSILDLEAAADYLIEKRGAVPEKICFIGASIGANLSLQYVAENSGFKTAILLSAGLNYHGIETEPLVKKMKSGQGVFFVSSKDDERSGGNNAEMNQRLYESTPAGVDKKIEIYQSGGHGTDILTNQPGLAALIIGFIGRNI